MPKSGCRHRNDPAQGREYDRKLYQSLTAVYRLVTSSNIAAIAQGVRNGERRALARAITLVESARPDHREQAQALLADLAGDRAKSLRIGLSGTPGVGKSTFTERFGTAMTEQGHRLAVLAVDPSSTVTGGSILGDKTRMDMLARNPAAFIRPSPSGGSLGGVARRTRETIALCEAAGFDLVIVETVGVGQSEIAVSRMTDIFLLLLAPAGGDELQGVKRGIMEIADLIVVNKADGDLKAAAQRTRSDYAAALRLMRRREGDAEGFPQAVTASSIEGNGIAEVAALIARLAEARRASGFHASRRQEQAVTWMESALEYRLKDVFEQAVPKDAMESIHDAVRQGALLPEAGAERLIDLYREAMRSPN